MISDWITRNYEQLHHIAKKSISITNTQHDAGDVVHEVCLAMLENEDRITSDNLFGYFKACVNNYIYKGSPLREEYLSDEAPIEEQTVVDVEHTPMSENKEALVDHPEFRLVEYLHIKHFVCKTALWFNIFASYFIFGYTVREIKDYIQQTRYRVSKIIDSITQRMQYA